MSSDILVHYGVKGMKWGVRKERYNKIRNRTLKSTTVTTKYGEKVNVRQVQSTKTAAAIRSLTRRGTEDWLKFDDYDISVGGKKVGNATLKRVSGDEINLQWLGIDSKFRGKGYATAVFGAAVEMGRKSGAKKLTLEVPGNSPDAKHIYERAGFKVVGEAEYDPLWGSLTNMEMDLREIRHSGDLANFKVQLEKALLQTFPQFSPEEERRVFSTDQNLIEHGEEFIQHFGVKGMKWGVRKAEKRAIKSMRKQRRNETRERNRIDYKDKYGRSERKTSNNATERFLRNEIGAKYGVGKLSDAELSARLKRIKMEKEYNKILREERDQQVAMFKSAGKFVANIAGQVITNVATQTATDFVNGDRRRDPSRYASSHTAYTVDTIRKALPATRTPARR